MPLFRRNIQVPSKLRKNIPLFSFSNPFESPNLHKYISEEFFEKVPNLFVGERPHGLSALRAIARSEGFFTVSPYQQPTQSTVKEAHEYIYGGPVVYADTPFVPAIHPITLPGLALHPGSPKLLFTYRGLVNPHLGFGKTHAIKKDVEYRVIENAWPGLMPPTVQLNQASWFNESYFDQQKKALTDSILELTDTSKQSIEKKLVQFIIYFEKSLKQQYPMGVHIKHVLGCYTVDSATILTADTIQPSVLAYALLRKIQVIGSTDLATIRRHLLNETDLRPLIIFECLFSPDNIILTQHIEIKQTSLGYPIEFRVDSLDFEGVVVRRRHPSTEPIFDYEKEIFSIVRALKNKLPQPFQYMSGGIDLALTTDNRWILLDVNPAGDSGFLMPGLLYNDFISKLIGKSSPLIKTMNRVSLQSTKIQHDFLMHLPHTILADPAINDIEEIALYLRDLKLMCWSQKPHELRESSTQIMNHFKKIFTPDLYDLGIRSDEILTSTEHYLTTAQSLLAAMEVRAQAITPAAGIT